MQVSVMKNKKLGIFLMLAGEAGESGEGKGARKKKDRWWGPLIRHWGSTEEEVPIKYRHLQHQEREERGT